MRRLSLVGVTAGWRGAFRTLRGTIAGLPEKRREHEAAKAAKPTTEKEIQHYHQAS